MMPTEILTSPGILQDVQILVADNDRDSGDLYAVLFASYGAKVTTTSSIKDALDLLNQFIPDILICELRFLGESVHSLIQQARYLSRHSGKPIPILVTSTCSSEILAQQLTEKVEAYLLKPLDLDRFVSEVCNLTHPSMVSPSQNLMMKLNIDNSWIDN
ncbi:MAG: response regulator [Scytolyngbya sp. HA4215-MV1]|jgi:CheY-like chemotaxis protein|nr:response regulator [Scytolyngbya sp. HA4215-MV1]